MSVVTPRPGVRKGTAAARTRSKLARAHQRGEAEAIPDLELQLREEIGADFLTQLLAQSPPLPWEARARLAGILTAGGAA